MTALDVEPLTRHPAKFSPEVLAVMRLLVRQEAQRLDVARPRLLDSFAGVGRVHELDDIADTVGVELRPRWAACHERTRVGDATRLPHWWTNRFHVWLTSPCYGNRLRDSHNATDSCKTCDGRGVAIRSVADVEIVDGSMRCRNCKGTGLSVRRSYTHDYGEPFEHPNDAGVLRFGTPQYARLHRRAYRQAHRVVMPGGAALLNVSDFYERKQLVDTQSWHTTAMLEAGWQFRRVVPVETRRLKFGANRDARAPHEIVLVFRKEAT